MPTWTWWLLLATVFVSLIIMVVATIITRKKIVKFRNEKLIELQSEINNKITNSINEENHKKLFENKPKDDSFFLDDFSLMFSINSFKRNNYKKVKLSNFKTNYEKENFQLSIKDIIFKNEDENDYDLFLTYDDEKTFLNIKNIYNNLNSSGLIIITNVYFKSKEYKKWIYELKILNYRYEFQKIGNGIILIAK